MNISQAAAASGLPIKTIRYYEGLGLVVPERQMGNEYRAYSLEDIDRLRFLQRTRAAGFALAECRELLMLHTDKTQRNSRVKALLAEKVQHLDQQLLSLSAIRHTLLEMTSECTNESDEVMLTQNNEISRSGSYMSMPFRLIDDSHD